MKPGILLHMTLLAAFSLLLATPAKAEEGKHFVIGVEDLHYYPLWYYDKAQGEYTGLARKMLDAFAESAGYEFEYKPYPIKRLVRSLVQEEIDFKFPDNPYWAKDVKEGTDVLYSDPAIHYIDGVFVKPENVGKGNDSIKTLGSVLGFTPWDWLGKIKAGDVTLKEVPGFDSLINQAIAGRIDGAYVNAAIVQYHLKTSGRTGAIVFDKDLFHTESDYMMSTVKHEGILKEFNQWMADHPKLIAQLKGEFEIE